MVNLTHRTIKNSIYSYVGFVWPLILSFVAAPIIIRTLGPSKFGFFSLLNTALTLFSLLDFGLSYTFIQQLSANREQPEGKELSSLFGSTLVLYSILGVIVLMALLLLPGAFQHLFKIPEGFISSFRLAFFILGAIFFLRMVTVPFAQVPYALQRLDIGTNISLVNNTILQIGSIIAIKAGYGILSLLIMQLISAAFVFLCAVFFWRYLTPNLHLHLHLPRHIVTTIGKHGFWIFLSNTMGNILAQLDKFVLGAMWGPTAVGYYSTAQMIPEKISGTSLSLSHIFFPIFAETAENQRDGEQTVKRIFRRSLGIIPVVTAGLAMLVYVYGYLLIRFWVSQDFANHTALALQLLALTYFLLGFGYFFNAFLGGLKALKFLALSTMITALTDLVFMFIFIPKHGLNGASLAYLLSSLPMLGFLYYIERKYFASKRRDILNFYGKLFGKIILVCLISYLLGVVLFRPLVSNLWLAISLGGLNYVLYLALYWGMGFMNPEDKALLKVYGQKFISYFKTAKIAQ